MPVLTDPVQLLRLTDPNYADGLSAMVDTGDPVEIARTVFDQDGDMPNGAGLSELVAREFPGLSAQAGLWSRRPRASFI